MRFYASGPSIPDVLLERCDAGRVVFLCGAGVSIPSGMPTFIGLTQYVIDFFGPPDDSEIMTSFLPWLISESDSNVPLDQIFNLLHLEYGKDEVNALVTERLSVSLEGHNFGREHSLIKRISSSQSGMPQIVTTNFDRLFELPGSSGQLKLHVPPAFPNLNFGLNIEGITYLHGRLVETAAESHPYVLSSADFGRAYLSEGWATNFIRHLLERYTVVLVGYKAEDPPVKYLLQGLNHDGQYDRSKLYAFDRGAVEDVEVKWRDRGVTGIAYADHSDLWKSMEAWAERSDDPRKWRLSTIAKSQRDPKELMPHERGQVAHVLRTVQGARAFSEAEPVPHPEWICVMDANVRSAEKSSGYGSESEIFDPVIHYGIDDDLIDISENERRQGVNNDNILVWREEDDNPHDSHRLGGRQVEGLESTPKRLGHLISWICKSINSPVLAWWAVRQNGLHPRLLHQIQWHLRHSKLLNERARHLWRLIVELHQDPRNRRWNGEWFDFKNLIDAEGWTPNALREFRRFAAPKLQISLPSGLGKSMPPSASWEEIDYDDLGRFEVSFLDRHNEELQVPDSQLSQVFGILEQQLTVVSSLLEDVDVKFFDTPTCYPGRDIGGRERVTSTAEPMIWFVQLFDRMASIWPEIARAHATTWSMNDQFFFRKLKLYAFSKVDVFDADHVAQAVLGLSQEALWDTDVVREFLFLLNDRWTQFPDDYQRRIAERIIAGPDQQSHWSDEEFYEARDRIAAKYARYLEIQGCNLDRELSQRLKEIIGGIPEWSDGWATSTVTIHGSRVGWVGTDETPDKLMNVPVNEVISNAKEDHQRDFDSFTDKRPFAGLVKTNPRKALSALTFEGKRGEYPTAFWNSMISDIPADIPPRMQRLFINRLARLPNVAVVELRYVLTRWLEQNIRAALDFDSALAWAVYDNAVDGIFSGDAGATESGVGEVRRGGKVVERSRRTYSYAINGPVGMCAAALLHAVPGSRQGANSLIPVNIKSRIERLFSAPGEGADHAVSIVARELNWLMFVDPVWTKHKLIPMLSFDHPVSEPAWNGFLHEDMPAPELAEVIKPLLLNLIPWINGLSWERNLSQVASQWLGLMRIFHPDSPSGLTRIEMRSVIRDMSDDERNQFIFWLGLVGKQNKNGWVKHVIPFINMDWPRERRYRTSASIKAWIGLLDDTGEYFPKVYEAVKKFLVPVEISDHPFYRFTQVIGNEKPIAVLHPEVTLDLMDAVTPCVLTRPPYELPSILALVVESAPSLQSDTRYLRLIELVEAS